MVSRRLWVVGLRPCARGKRALRGANRIVINGGVKVALGGSLPLAQRRKPTTRNYLDTTVSAEVPRNAIMDGPCESILGNKQRFKNFYC